MAISSTLIVENQQLNSVRVVQSTNLIGTYYNGPANNGVGATYTHSASSLVIDSVTIAVGDRVLFTAQTNSYQNGIYVVSSIGANIVFTRTVDFQEPSQMKSGQYIPVAAGGEFGGAVFTVIEPNVQVVGIDAINITHSSTSVESLTLLNTGLKIYNPAQTFLTTIQPTTAITADRTFSLVTGDADRTLDLSAGNLAPTATGLSLVQAANVNAALNALTLKAALTAVWNGGGTTNSFAITGLLATDIVVATLYESTNVVSFSAIAAAGQLDVTFSADPGVGTRLSYIVFPVIT